MSTPFIKITIGDDVFSWGDGFLKSVSWSLGEGQNSSSCEFSIYDPGRKYTDKYLAYIEEIQGLEPLVKPTPKPQSTGMSGTTANGEFSNNVKAILDTIAWAEGADYNIRFGGFAFDSFADHPRQRYILSDAAGRYQALSSTWDEEVAQNGYPDFSPKYQDLFAVERLKFRNALGDVEAGDWLTVLEKISWEWASLPPFRYEGQGTKTTEQVLAYIDQRLKYYGGTTQVEEAAAVSVQSDITTEIKKSNTPSGAAITIEYGMEGEAIAQSAFIHTGLNYQLYPNSTLTFTGQAATWLLAQRRKNTAFSNLNFKQLATKLASNFGMTVNMDEDGPTYEYIKQAGVSDHDFLLSEARRLGYRVTVSGKEITIKREKRSDDFAIVLGGNLGLEFNVSHEAQGESSGGARSADPSEKSSSGQRKFVIDPDTGMHKQIRAEDRTGAPNDETATTGAAVAPLKPIEKNEMGDDAKNNALRVKGILASITAPTSNQLLLVDPDTPFETRGVSDTLDRYWVVDSISHSFDSGGCQTAIEAYSPLKNKYPASASSNNSSAPVLGGSGTPPPLNANGFIKPMEGIVTSRWRTARRPNHRGIDIANGGGTPIWASADGVVTDVENSCVVGVGECGDGYGNLVFIQHADGYETRYTHMVTGSVTVSIGQQVKQGQVIGLEGNTGRSDGDHVHFEIRKDGADLNPLQFIPE